MTEQDKLILLPVLLQVLLTIVVYFALVVAKIRAKNNGEVDLKKAALYDDAWPESVVKINNNIRNQFQLPVLFYVVTIVLWLLDSVGMLALALAWIFVASRAVHAYVHTGSNYVPLRRGVFTFGFFIVTVMLGMAIWAAVTS